MLLASPRHTVHDLEHWKRLEIADSMRARHPGLAHKEDAAIQRLRSFASGGNFFVSASWGKDSVVVAHLAWRSGWRRMHWFPAGFIENPDCHLVRDAFLARFEMDYSEIEAADPVVGEWGHDGAQRAFERASAKMGGRYASGVRAEESATRKRRMVVFGHETENTCAAIGWWSTDDVFAYLHKHDLPIHPAYACTRGGTIDRNRIRVGTIGGQGGTGWGRREWERTYYPAELRAIYARMPSLVQR